MPRAKSAIDGQLFLVRHRHLLILRDIARKVDLALRDKPQEGGADGYIITGGYILFYPNHRGILMGHRHITDTLSSMLSLTSTHLPGTPPKVCAEHLSDAKRVSTPS